MPEDSFVPPPPKSAAKSRWQTAAGFAPNAPGNEDAVPPSIPAPSGPPYVLAAKKKPGTISRFLNSSQPADPADAGLPATASSDAPVAAADPVSDRLAARSAARAAKLAAGSSVKQFDPTDIFGALVPTGHAPPPVAVEAALDSAVPKEDTKKTAPAASPGSMPTQSAGGLPRVAKAAQVAQGAPPAKKKAGCSGPPPVVPKKKGSGPPSIPMPKKKSGGAPPAVPKEKAGGSGPPPVVKQQAAVSSNEAAAPKKAVWPPPTAGDSGSQPAPRKTQKAVAAGEVRAAVAVNLAISNRALGVTMSWAVTHSQSPAL